MVEIRRIPVSENGCVSKKQPSDMHQKLGIAALDSLLDSSFATWSLFRIEPCCSVSIECICKRDPRVLMRKEPMAR